MPKRRYTKREQIVEAIHAARQQAKDAIAEAESLEKSARRLFRLPTEEIEAKQEMEEAKALRVRADNLINNRCRKLGQKLGEFDTQILEPLVPDSSIPARLT